MAPFAVEVGVHVVEVLTILSTMAGGGAHGIL